MATRSLPTRPDLDQLRRQAIADYDFRTAVVLGDADRVRDYLANDPGLAAADCRLRRVAVPAVESVIRSRCGTP